jgi:hypothetical protein
MGARGRFLYGVTGITPAMARRLTGTGSQYLLAMVDMTPYPASASSVC